MNPANSQEALAQLQQTQAQSQDPNSILSGQRQQLGVDNAQQTVTGLRGAINNTTKLLKQVAPSVMGRTADSLVTNAQAVGQVANEQKPIAQNLSDQSTEYNQANTDLSELQRRAQESASGIYAGQQDKLSYAQNLYNTLYQKERDAQAAQQAEADRQEQTRQFNASLSAKNPGPINPNLASGEAPKAFSQQRTGGGYNFQDNAGNAISAARYAQLTGQDLGSVLLKMGQGGDKYAAQAYNALKSNGDPNSVKKQFNAIFWGT